MKARSPISHVISFVMLMAFWLLMSGKYDAFYITLGVLSVGVVMALDAIIKRHMFFTDEVDSLRTLRYAYLPVFVVWLIGQVVLSGIHVAKLILHPKLPIATAIVTFRVDLPNPQARVILANAITLTPGTLTILVEGDHFTVHALSPASYEGILDGSMPDKVLRLFQPEGRAAVSDVVISPVEGA
jgi:multicomponent Na+:H+ antiporter subunit E